MILDDKLRNQEIIVLDGAVGSEIERFGGAMSSSAWCGVANKTHPEVVRRVHEEYIRAGADVVTANTFATNRWETTISTSLLCLFKPKCITRTIS